MNRTITIWTQDAYEKSFILPEGEHEYSDRGMILFQKWCRDTNTFYYARPKEDFFVSEGMILAQQAGATYLFLEDMS